MADSLEIAGVKTVRPDIFKSPSEMPVDQLADRIRISKQYIWDGIERDCRKAQDFLDEWRGKELYRHFSETWEGFCIEHLERPAEWLDHIAKGLALLTESQKQKPVPASEAIRAVKLKETTAPDRKRQPSPETLAKAAKARELREKGLTQKQIGEELGCSLRHTQRLLRQDTSYNITSVMSHGDTYTRPDQRGTSQEYRQALLERDAPELAEEVKAGKLTTNQAMVKAGKVKSKNFSISPKTDLNTLAQKLLTHDRQLAVALAEAIIDQTQETL